MTSKRENGGHIKTKENCSLGIGIFSMCHGLIACYLP